MLVLVHEFGHFWTAKKMGMRVDEFGIGFPPKLASIKKGETEYSFNALPIGGFVRIYGEDALDQDGNVIHDPRAFAGKSKWAQALVLIAGVTANVLFAWLLFALALGIGTPTAVSEAEATDAAKLYVVNVVAESPAALAAIPVGARVNAVSSGVQTVTPRSAEAFSAIVAGAQGAPISVAYTYDGEQATTVIEATEGIIDDAPEQAAIGVVLSLVETKSLPIHEALGEGFMMTITGLRDIAVGLYSLLADAFVLEADLSQVAGPVGIVGLVDDASALGFTTLLIFTAFISLNLAIINLFPFPALDGGRLLFVLIETIKGSPIAPKIAYYTNAAGFMLLLLLMAVITFNDVLRLV